MIRYNRRDRPDYSHLKGKTPDQIFAETYARGAPGEHSGHYPERVNRELIGLFNERETLPQDEAAAVYGALLAKPAHTPEYTADRAASLLAWGIRLGILTAATEDGRLMWRLRERELMWETNKRGRAVQIRGLPDAAQAAMNRKREAQAKAAATRQAKAAEANTPRIARAVDSLLIIRPDYIAPDHPLWREVLPNALLPATLAELRPMLVEAHHSMDPHRQRRWISALETMCSVLRLTGSVDRGPPPGERGIPLPLDRPPAPTHVPDLRPPGRRRRGRAGGPVSAPAAAYADDWTGAALATRRCQNPLLAVEVSPAADALTIRMRDGTTCILRAADVRPLASGGRPQDAIREAVVRACQQNQRNAA